MHRNLVQAKSQIALLRARQSRVPEGAFLRGGAAPLLGIVDMELTGLCSDPSTLTVPGGELPTLPKAHTTDSPFPGIRAHPTPAWRILTQFWRYWMLTGIRNRQVGQGLGQTQASLEGCCGVSAPAAPRRAAGTPSRRRLTYRAILKVHCF